MSGHRTTFRRPRVWHNSPTEYEVVVDGTVIGQVWRIAVGRQMGGTGWAWSGAPRRHGWRSTRAAATAMLLAERLVP